MKINFYKLIEFIFKFYLLWLKKFLNFFYLIKKCNFVFIDIKITRKHEKLKLTN